MLKNNCNKVGNLLDIRKIKLRELKIICTIITNYNTDLYEIRIEEIINNSIEGKELMRLLNRKIINEKNNKKDEKMIKLNIIPIIKRKNQRIKSIEKVNNLYFYYLNRRILNFNIYL